MGYTDDDEEPVLFGTWPSGRMRFENIFTSVFKRDREFFNEWKKQIVSPPYHSENPPALQNYAFRYRDMNFIALDFVPSKPIQGFKGVGFDAVLYDSTKDWLKEYLNKWNGKKVIVFSHYPMTTPNGGFSSGELMDIAKIIKDNNNEVLTFAGHAHGCPGKGCLIPGEWWDANHWYIQPVCTNYNVLVKCTEWITLNSITTEALMVGANQIKPEGVKGMIRIVNVDGRDIEYMPEKAEGDFYALNPYFKQIKFGPVFKKVSFFKRVPVWKAEFELYSFTKLYPLFYTLDFGDRLDPFTDIVFEEPTRPIEHDYPKEGGTYKVEFTAENLTLGIRENITRNITLQPWDLSPFALSPVDIILTDPNGLTISNQMNEIPGATYFETDLDGNGDVDDVIILSDHKMGDYQVTIMPEPDANPADTYTYGVVIQDNIIYLAQDVQISNIPAQPYIIRSTETEIIPILPATIDFDPYTLNLKSKGELVTVYIELPAGHGYDVSQIDLGNVMLNGQVKAEVKPTQIGDHDGDGIADLMVKFDRAAVIGLFAGKPVPADYVVEVMGTVKDVSSNFKGSDVIRVISGEK